MMMSLRDDLLQLTINDNVLWCSAICEAHGANIDSSAPLWLNLKSSPRFYPNIISTEPGAQAQVCEAIERLRSLGIPKGWGIKDSFSDLALDDLGFETVITGNWFGGVPNMPSESLEHWKKALSVIELRDWETAWGGDNDIHTFPDALIKDNRIEFWCKSKNGMLEAGFICFRTESSVGVSNWFSSQNQSIFDIGALDVVSSNFPGVPVVFWAPDDSAIQIPSTMERLAPLKVWISKF